MHDSSKIPKPTQTEASNRSARVWDGPAIFRTTALMFDGGDKANGSLYLCDPSNGQQSKAVGQAIDLLRAHSLWSMQDAKQVRDDQRQAYEDQLVFVEAAEVVVGGSQLVIARCNHPKFPSISARFDAWKTALDAAP